MKWWLGPCLDRGRCARVLMVLGLAVLPIAGCGLVGGGDDLLADGTVVAGATVEGKVPAKAAVVLLTNDNWDIAVANADRYRGSPVDLTGQLFNVLGDYDGATHYQLFTDPQLREGNTHLAVPPGNLALQDGDVVRVLGTFDHVLVTTSRGGDELRLPYVVVESIEVLAGPTFALITPTPIATPTPTATEVVVPALTATAIATPTLAPAVAATPTITPTIFATPSSPSTATPTAMPQGVTPSAVPTMPSAPAASFNAEVRDNIAVSGSITNIGDANSPSGHYFAGTTSTKEWNGSGPLPNNAAAANFAVGVPSDGRYAVWVRMQYQTVDANSLWLRVDDGKAVLLGNDDGGYGIWRWVAWQDGNPSKRVTVDLAAGAHTITLVSREAGTRFDSVLITGDISYQPPMPVSIASQFDPTVPAAAPSPPPPATATPTRAPAPAAVVPPTAITQWTATPRTNSPTPAPTTATSQPTAVATLQPTAAKPSPTATALATATRPPATTATPRATATNPPSPTPVAQATTTKPPSPTTTTQATATRPPATTATSIPTATAAPSATRVANNHPDSYAVKPGDTLSGIAQQMYGDAGQYQRIYAANRDKLSSPDRISPGTQLTIPK